MNSVPIRQQAAAAQPHANELQVADMRPEDIYGPDERQAVLDYLQADGFEVLGADWQGPGRRLDIAAADHGVLVVFDIRRPHNRWHRPLHDITHAKQRQLHLLAAEWMVQRGRPFVQTRIDVICVNFVRTSGYAIEHVRGVDGLERDEPRQP